MFFSAFPTILPLVKKMNLKEKAHQLPARPGVYFMRDKAGEILYVGKAKRLNKRVISYFLPSTPQSRKNQRMIFHIHDFTYQVVDTELEALLLEQQMIAKLHPPYNRIMNYAERYHYIQFVEELRITAAPDEHSFGPFAMYKQIPEWIRIMNDLYDLPDKRWQMPVARALHEKRRALLPPLSADSRETEIRQVLTGSDAAIQRITFQQEQAIQQQAFEWAQALEEDKKLLRRFRKQSHAIQEILQPKPRYLYDKMDKERRKVFLVYQGKIVAGKVLHKNQDFEMTLFDETALPPVENFIPLSELDNRLIIARYLEQAELTKNTSYHQLT